MCCFFSIFSAPIPYHGVHWYRSAAGHHAAVSDAAADENKEEAEVGNTSMATSVLAGQCQRGLRIQLKLYRAVNLNY